MKPTPQVIDQKQLRPTFPLTDCNFRATTDVKSHSDAILPQKKLRAPWKLSAEFFGAEASRDYVAELSCFVLIGAISAWPIISMLHAITRMVRNY